MNKEQEKLIKKAGLDDRFVIGQTQHNCLACSNTEAPCQVDRDKQPATWWMHQAISLRIEAAETLDVAWNTFNQIQYVDNYLLASGHYSTDRTEEKDGPLAPAMNIVDSIEKLLTAKKD